MYETRFREKVPRTPRTFRGGKNGKRITSGTLMGTMKEYNSAGALIRSEPRYATGDLPESFATERCWDEVHLGPPWVDGGNFAKVKILVPSSGTTGYGRYSSVGNPNFSGHARVEYIGCFAFDGWNPDSITQTDYQTAGFRAPYVASHTPSLAAYEIKAWDKIRPRIEKASVPQFLWELKDLPRMYQTTAGFFKDAWSKFGGKEGTIVMSPRKAADHFLNHHFGWVPFVSDLIKFYDVYQKSEEYILDAKARNGTWTKRKGLLEESFTDQRIYYNTVAHTLPGLEAPMYRIQSDPVMGNFGAFTEVRTRLRKKVWAEGKFYQYRPEFDPDLLARFPSDWSKTRQLLQLYGIRINPATLYRITPWTWLIDWFIGVGRNIEILSNSLFDAVAAKYAYLMCRQTKEVVMTTTHLFWSGTLTCSRTYSIDSKVRAEMLSPYGFTKGWADLSAKQLAILGALGINRKGFQR